MEAQTRERIIMMFKSPDSEMRNLACSLFMTEMDCWQDYEEFRSLTWEGKALIPKHLKKRLRARANHLQNLINERERRNRRQNCQYVKQ